MRKWLMKVFGVEESIPVKEPEVEKTGAYFNMYWSITTDGRVKLEQDWNSDFIKELRKKGFVGTSEEQIVQRFLTMINNQQVLNDAEDYNNEYK